MVKYAIFCNGLQGSSYYYRREEAEEAARWRTYCTGMEWIVKEIMVR